MVDKKGGASSQGSSSNRVPRTDPRNIRRVRMTEEEDRTSSSVRRSKRLMEKRALLTAQEKDGQKSLPFPVRRSNRLMQMYKLDSSEEISPYRDCRKKYLSAPSTVSTSRRVTVYLKQKNILSYRGIMQYNHIRLEKMGFFDGSLNKMKCRMFVDTSAIRPFMTHGVAEKFHIASLAKKCSYVKLPGKDRKTCVKVLPVSVSVPMIGEGNIKNKTIYVKVNVLPKGLKWYQKADLLIDCQTLHRNGLIQKFSPRFSCLYFPLFRLKKYLPSINSKAFFYSLSGKVNRKSLPVSVLLDTSSTRCRVSEAFLREKTSLPLGCDNISEVEMKLGRCFQVSMRNVKVTSDNRFDLVLGRSVMRQYTCRLDYIRELFYVSIPPTMRMLRTGPNFTSIISMKRNIEH